MHNKVIKIAITGGESTGKSTLSTQLAAYYHTISVPEYAREYASKLHREYVPSDILHIAQQQLALENEYTLQANNVLFCDTDLLVTKVWCEHAFGFCDAWIEQNILQADYALYLLMYPDIPWQYDPLREHPHLQLHFFDIYKALLQTYKKPFVVIDGTGAQRVQNAIQAVNSYL